MDLFSKKFTVTLEQTAKAVGSGDLEVLATPSLSTMIENTAKDYLAKELTSEETSVGSYLELNHLKPSAVGADIIIYLNSVIKDRAKVTYTFEAYDAERKIATGQHVRFIVKTAPFLAKLKETKEA
jgi:fluoroacetyl-CoA thioesterase